MGLIRPDEPLLACRSDQMGFFTWELAEDRIFADEIFGQHFDIGIEDLQRGIPIDRILERIRIEDRPRIAAAIHSAIVTGQPYQETYTVVHANGTAIVVAAMGRCFQYSDGTPSHYAGTVVEVKPRQPKQVIELLKAHCREAVDLSRATGEQLAERYLSSALRLLEGKPDLPEN